MTGRLKHWALSNLESWSSLNGRVGHLNPGWLDCSKYTSCYFRVPNLACKSILFWKKATFKLETHPWNHSYCQSTDYNPGPFSLSHTILPNCLSSLILPYLLIKIVIQFLILVFCMYFSCLYREIICYIWRKNRWMPFYFFMAGCFWVLKAAAYWKLLH